MADLKITKQSNGSYLVTPLTKRGTEYLIESGGFGGEEIIEDEIEIDSILQDQEDNLEIEMVKNG